MLLTARQALIVSRQNAADSLHTNALLAEFPGRPLSLRSVIRAYESQRILVFVTLISTKVFLSPNITSVGQLIQASHGADGQMIGQEVLAPSSKLREQCLSLRVLDKDLRRAAIVGTSISLVTAPTTAVK